MQRRVTPIYSCQILIPIYSCRITGLYKILQALATPYFLINNSYREIELGVTSVISIFHNQRKGKSEANTKIWNKTPGLGSRLKLKFTTCNSWIEFNYYTSSNFPTKQEQLGSSLDCFIEHWRTNIISCPFSLEYDYSAYQLIFRLKSPNRTWIPSYAYGGSKNSLWTWSRN